MTLTTLITTVVAGLIAVSALGRAFYLMWKHQLLNFVDVVNLVSMGFMIAAVIVAIVIEYWRSNVGA